MEAHAMEVLTGLVGVGILAVFRLSFKVDRLDQAVRGIDGRNGLVGTTKELRTRTHRLGEIVGWVSNRVYDLEQIEGVEARPMPAEQP